MAFPQRLFPAYPFVCRGTLPAIHIYCRLLLPFKTLILRVLATYLCSCFCITAILHCDSGALLQAAHFPFIITGLCSHLGFSHLPFTVLCFTFFPIATHSVPPPHTPTMPACLYLPAIATLFCCMGKNITLFWDLFLPARTGTLFHWLHLPPTHPWAPFDYLPVAVLAYFCAA